MAQSAGDPIGNVNAIYLKSVDQLGNEYQTNITGKNFTVKPNATYRQVDAAMRSLRNIITNNYVDTVLITAVSVNEVMDSE